jgi:DNA-directed RNA polymerase specialized sigma24 family protein
VLDHEFEELARSEAVGLLRTAWAMTGNWHDAQDLVQTAIEISWKKREQIANPDRALHYVRAVMTTAFLRSRRRFWRREHAAADAGDWEAIEPRYAELR